MHHVDEGVETADESEENTAFQEGTWAISHQIVNAHTL